MTASTLCTDSVDEAREIDSYFPDILAYLRTIEAPLWPGEVDEELAAAGKTVFEATCSECHGTYGEEETYPNLVVSIDVVGTDPVLARGSLSGGTELIEWYNESFYGELALAAPADGYIALLDNQGEDEARRAGDRQPPRARPSSPPHHRPLVWHAPGPLRRH